MTGLTVAFGVVAAFGNVVGAAIALQLDQLRGRGVTADEQISAGKSAAILHGLLPLGAGFLLAVTLMEMIPDAIALTRPVALAGPMLLAGYALLHVIESRLDPHIHLPETPAGAPVAPRMVYTAFLGLTLHAFFDGVAVGSGAALSPSLGGLLLIAIVLHKIPEGATVASLAVLSHLGRRAALVLPLLLGLSTVVGAAAVMLIARNAIGQSLAFASGVTLYVAATDLIPHAREARRSAADSLWVYAGILIFALTDQLLRRTGFH
jgi:zinc transporter ZupT